MVPRFEAKNVFIRWGVFIQDIVMYFYDVGYEKGVLNR